MCRVNHYVKLFDEYGIYAFEKYDCRVRWHISLACDQKLLRQSFQAVIVFSFLVLILARKTCGVSFTWSIPSTLEIIHSIIARHFILTFIALRYSRSSSHI
ncbi:unnamed protein product [Albugo candida]|uniref:Uncharacterized protein n=1 Tax=Albugo candida TaxID=65357 RepID=A0A024G5H4_9STRA|nr:unnamed protein product [Albugo candida]|eukprot:CCI42006.1 unnamed protein product [Albugo candida]